MLFVTAASATGTTDAVAVCNPSCSVWCCFCLLSGYQPRPERSWPNTMARSVPHSAPVAFLCWLTCAAGLLVMYPSSLRHTLLKMPPSAVSRNISCTLSLPYLCCWVLRPIVVFSVCCWLVWFTGLGGCLLSTNCGGIYRSTRPGRPSHIG